MRAKEDHLAAQEEEARKVQMETMKGLVANLHVDVPGDDEEDEVLCVSDLEFTH